jgi:RNA-binding protein YlmH
MESELLTARLEDTLDSSYVSSKPKFLGFFSLEESVFAKKFLEKRNANFSLFGGFDNSQRVMLCCYPEYIENPQYPITAITFKYRISDELRHRDFLGSLMALGLKRETVGDILIEAGRAVVFLKSDIADFVIENIRSVGRVGVTLRKGFDFPLPETDELKESSQTVASLRLDCVVSALASCSRNTAVELIENGLVAVNSAICQKPTKTVSNGDVLSVRRKGKFQIVSTDKKTKKDRIVLIYKTY